MNADVVVHAYDTTPVDAQLTTNGRDVDVRVGEVRIWLPAAVAEQLHTVLGEALAVRDE